MLISTFNAIARYYEELPAELQKACCQPALPLMGNLIVGEALMMQQSGARRCALATVLLLLSSCGLRSSESAIRRRLLIRTPLGSPRTTVVQTINRAQLAITRDNAVTNWSDRLLRERGATSYLSVYLGHYRALTRVDVVAYYMFDDAQRLFDIVVIKEVDSW